MIKTKNSPIDKENEVSDLKVFFTKDLDGFSFIQGNRTPNPMHVARLKRSMESNGLLKNPILVNSRNEIIDGQHRYLAAKDLGLGVYYIVIGDYGLREIHALNLNQKNWTNKDYMEGYANMGVESYVELRRFTELYPIFPMGASISIMSGKTGASIHGRGNIKANTKDKNPVMYNVREVFSEGTWKCLPIDKGIDIAEKLIEVGEYYKKYNISIFVKSYIGLLKKDQFDHKQFLHKLSQQPSALVDCATISQYVAVIEEIYNYRNKYKVNLRY